MEARPLPTETHKPKADDGEYSDQSWEMVGDVKFTEDFEPLKLEELASDTPLENPLFESYGGNELRGAPARFHLPADLARDVAKEVAEVEEGIKQSLSDEEIQAIKDEAFALGVVDGKAQAEAAQSTRFQNIESQMSEVLKDIQVQLNEHLVGVEKQAVEFTLALAEKIIFRTVEINPEYITKIIHEAIALTGSAKLKRVRVSKEDFEFIEFAGVLNSIKEFDGTWQFEADEAVKAGCVVETSAGEIDYQLDAAWERVKNNVVKVMK